MNCRRAIDVVTARRGLNRTNTVHEPPLTAGAVSVAGVPGASGPEVQVSLVTVKSWFDAVSGAVAWTVTPVIESGASPRFSTLTGTGCAISAFIEAGFASTAVNDGGAAYSAGAAAPRTLSKLVRAAANASNAADAGSSS